MSVRIDARGLRCPWPAIRLAKAMRDDPSPEFVILADDPAAPGEIERVAVAAGARFLREGEGTFCIRRPC